jgi:hypothetical protein
MQLKSEVDFGLRFATSRGSRRAQTGPRTGREAEMDTHSPDTKALIWTGSIVAAIVVLALIAFYGGLVPVSG